jgi:tripartite-type tricarboxylate transporter receptor subunit TctC
MKILLKIAGSSLFAALCMTGIATPVQAQDFPGKPITIVIPYAPGGSTDVLGRMLAHSMSNFLKQPIVVENVGGAGGTLGAARVARANADGYTLLFHNTGHAAASALYKNLTYDPQTSFEPIGSVADVPMILVARKNFPADNYAELAAYAKANPEKVLLANAGTGATSHLCAVLFNNVTGLKTTLVPYKGTGPALNDIAGGHVDMICDQPASTTGFIKQGILKGIAVATKARIPTLKEVPTFAESGLKNFELFVWHGLYAPKGTPAPALQKINAALKHALSDKELVAKFEGLGAEPAKNAAQTPEGLHDLLAAETARLGAALKMANVPKQ